MPGPASPPKMARLKMNTSWLAMETPLIWASPRAPTIRLSSRFTKVEIPFWMITGTMIARTAR